MEELSRSRWDHGRVLLTVKNYLGRVAIPWAGDHGFFKKGESKQRWHAFISSFLCLGCGSDVFSSSCVHDFPTTTDFSGLGADKSTFSLTLLVCEFCAVAMEKVFRYSSFF